MLRFVGLLLSLLLTAGCGAVVSDHPIAGEDDAVVDEALIGWWEPVPKEVEPGRAQHRVAVGRMAGSESALELVMMDIEKKTGHVKVERFTLYATTVAGKRYLSMTDTKEKKEYMLLRYAIDKQGVMTLDWMEDGAVAKQIEAKQVEGVATKNPKYTELSMEAEYKEVRLTAKPAALRTWLAQAGDTPWFEEPIRFRKVTLQKPDDPKGKAEAK